jgi:gamma-glutamylcyclotransferase (GGCT)/AIG2-like uncharacterized protein YtfP
MNWEKALSKPHLIFVYGTLRDHGFDTVAINDHINGHVIDMGTYPALISLDTPLEIEGDVISVDSATLETIDRYEGCPALYTRETITTKTGLSAFVYLWTGYRPIKAWGYGGDHVYHS